MSIHDFNKGMTDEQLNSQAPILNRYSGAIRG